MPPQAGEFRYTPMSYLQQKTRTENRPWTETENTDDDYHHVQNRLASTVVGIKKGSREQHFQSRVADKRERYRAMLKGEQQQQDNEFDFYQDPTDPFLYDYDGSDSSRSPNEEYWAAGSSPQLSSPPRNVGGVYQNSHTSMTAPRVHHGPPSVPRAPVVSAPGPSINPRISPSSPALKKAEARAARLKRLAAQREEFERLRVANEHQVPRTPMVAAKETSGGSHSSRSSYGSAVALARRDSVTSDSSDILHRRVRDLRGCLEADHEETQRLEELRSRRLAEERSRKLALEKHAQDEFKRQEEEEAEQRRQKDERRQRKLKDVEDYERAQLDAAEAARERAQEDRRLQQETRRRSMDILQAEQAAKRRYANQEAEAPRLSLIQEFQEVVRDSGIFQSCVSSCFGDEDFQEETITKKKSSSTKKRSKKKVVPEVTPVSSDSSESEGSGMKL